MHMSMYQASVAIFLQRLPVLSQLLDKAIAHAADQGIDPANLVSAQLAPDMLPLKKQIHIATDHAKGCAARLAGVDIPVFDDTESTLEELKARIAKTVAYLQTLAPAQIDGSENRAITLTIRTGELHFNGLSYLQTFALPNFFFHLVTAYDILRNQGVPLGKRDYLGTA